MRRHRAALGAAAVIAAVHAALGLAGCGLPDSPAPPSAPPLTSPAPRAGALPAPEALTDVLYRIADPGVPGTAKLALVQDATPGDAATLDRFATALKDSGYTPPTFAAGDLSWSDANPVDVLATITVTRPDHDGGGSFPMEFAPRPGGWQLSRDTFTMLLDFSSAPR